MIDDFPGLQEKQAQTCACLVAALHGPLRPALMKNIFNNPPQKKKSLRVIVGLLSIIRINKSFNPWFSHSRRCSGSSMRNKVGTLGNADEHSGFSHGGRRATVIRAAAWPLVRLRLAHLSQCLPSARLSLSTDSSINPSLCPFLSPLVRTSQTVTGSNKLAATSVRERPLSLYPLLLNVGWPIEEPPLICHQETWRQKLNAPKIVPSPLLMMSFSVFTSRASTEAAVLSLLVRRRFTPHFFPQWLPDCCDVSFPVH